MDEVWKPIKSYEDHYLISNFGRVKAIKRKIYVGNFCEEKFREFQTDRILKLCDRGNGYYVVTLGNATKKKNFYVHRLVAEHFIDNPNNYPVVNHKDFNPKNNRVDNLEWCTYEYNAGYSAVNMKKPTLSKAGSTGKRYIHTYRTKAGKLRYRVLLKGHKQIVGILTLEDAVKRRNELLENDEYYAPIKDFIIADTE